MVYHPAFNEEYAYVSGGNVYFDISKLNDYYVLTNHHVVNDENGKSTLISLTSGDKKIKCSATVVYQNKKHDIALLQAKIASEPVPYIPIIKDYSNLRPGTNVLVIGKILVFIYMVRLLKLSQRCF